MASRLVPTLVYGDLRGAGHELLSRSDLDLRWALTLHEAIAVSIKVDLDLVLASDDFALAYLETRRDLPRKPPCIVLLGEDHLDKRAELEAAGAAALVSASEPQRVVEAISELTGLTFRDHPRVPLSTVVDVRFRGESHFLTTFDLSVSGVCIKDVPGGTYGDRATLTFDLFDPPITAEAMVVRTFNLPEAHCTGLCFTEISDADRARVGELVKQELAALPMFTTQDLSDAIGENTTDLLTALSRKTDAGLAEYLNMVKGIVDGWEDDTPTWIFEVAGKLTDTERKAMSTDQPGWAKAAVGFRIELKRQVVDPSAIADYEPAMEFIASMAHETGEASVEEAVDATAIRSAILRAVYTLHRTIKEREAQKARKNRQRTSSQ